MIGKQPGFRAIVQINARFIHAGLAIFYGWLCWQWSSPEWWGLALIAALCIAAGGVHLLVTLFKVIGMIKRNRQVETFKRQGRPAHADRLVTEAELKSRGLIR